MKYFFLFLMILLLSVGVSLGGFAHGEIALVNTRTGKNTDSIFWQSNANNTVPVDGISFETVVSEPVLKIPENRSGVLTPIRLGIRITNNTSEPVRFSLSHLTPEFINFNDELLFAGAVQFRLGILEKRNFPLLLPKESFSFFWEGGFFWNENMLRLIIDDINHGRSWSFGGFNPGISRVRFKYNYDYEGQYYDEDVRGFRQFKGVIKGSFLTNWVEINLIQP
ncbi:hypothetical protein [Microcoleus sp. herbarium14]|uniref:hypothetical protein n=1 Tax=Microcoleus sp. herbarium14 TaxID=3055439 RepID=UPI002FD4A8D8